MPGVLVVEAMAQTAGALCAANQDIKTGRNQVLLMTIDKAKFRKPIVPGDQLRLHMHKINKRRTSGGIVARPRSTACWSARRRSRR